MVTPTRFKNGLALNDTGALKDLSVPVAASPLVDFDHFTSFNLANDWTLNETQAGATQALITGQGGLLKLTNSAADSDVNEIQKIGAAWRVTAGKKSWFEARVSISEATDLAAFIGLGVTQLDLNGNVNDVMAFLANDGSTDLNFASWKDGAGSSVLAFATLDADVFHKYSFYYDGKNLRVYFDDQQVGYVGESELVFPDDEDLRVSFGIKNGSAVAHSMTIDYYIAAQELSF